MPCHHKGKTLGKGTIERIQRTQNNICSVRERVNRSSVQEEDS